jgi:hypothetical protein
MEYRFKLIKIGKIAGVFYTAGKNRQAIVVYGIGAPIPPDNGNLPDAPVILKHNVDLFVPDYIGYGRSDGIFTPMNCIKTFLNLYEAFKEGCVGVDYYENKKYKMKYQRIIFIGRSLGGTYVPLLPRFNKEIKELGIFCPVVDSQSCGLVKGEESNADFLRSMKDGGYHHLYRGILDPKWKDHLENKDDLSPVDNVGYLKEARLFIAHGKQDKCVHYSKSKAYYQKIMKVFPEEKDQFILKLYPTGDHGPKTTNLASKDFLAWLKI